MAKLRDNISTQGEANRLAGAVKQWLVESDPTALFQTCFTCFHSDKNTAMCKKFKRVPPVAIIAGHQHCTAYNDDYDIPF